MQKNPPKKQTLIMFRVTLSKSFFFFSAIYWLYAKSQISSLKTSLGKCLSTLSSLFIHTYIHYLYKHQYCHTNTYKFNQYLSNHDNAF